MELKRDKIVQFVIHNALLIVPYGIETTEDDDIYLSVTVLLIVPYGIETRNSAFELILECLLIVP